MSHNSHNQETETIQLPTISNVGTEREPSTPAPSYVFQELSGDEATGSAASSGSDVAAGVLRIEFAASRVTSDVVEGWRSGDLVAFDEPISTQVRIYLGTELVGLGEIIDVDGQLAVKVTEALPKPIRKAA